MDESKRAGDLKASAALADPSFPAVGEACSPGPGAPRKKLVIERKSPRTRFRGMPPPLTFDIYALPDTTRLDETEAAAALRRSKSCLENWRKDPKHPLTWKLVAGRILYDLPPIRALLNGNSL